MKDIILSFNELTHTSAEFEDAYAVFSSDIAPAFLEEKKFLRNRLRVRDQGARTEHEKILDQDGYSLHLIAARHGGRVAGAIYGHLISGIKPDNRGIGFVTYISVLPDYRRQGIGSALIEELRKKVNQ